MRNAAEIAPPASIVGDIWRETSPFSHSEEADRGLIRSLMDRRTEFGITRIGSITGLDRIGIPVVQVTRPLSLTNAVSQGKGVTLFKAAVSALMEELEVWAGEAMPPDRLHRSSAKDLGQAVVHVYEDWSGPNRDWASVSLTWRAGYDLLTDRILPVPAALVDTTYTVPSPHPAIFPRTTTGLGAGRTLTEAIVHAGREILERDAVARAHARPHFFDTCQVSAQAVSDGQARAILNRIGHAGLLAGIWRVPAPHALPVYWCQVMEKETHGEIAPLPAQGFGCDVSHDRALARALLEACQARLAAISGAREDITRHHYPRFHDRNQLSEWRRHLERSDASPWPATDEQPPQDPLTGLIDALRNAGARATLVVPLYRDDEANVFVVRVIAPPLLPAPGHANA